VATNAVGIPPTFRVILNPSFSRTSAARFATCSPRGKARRIPRSARPRLPSGTGFHRGTHRSPAYRRPATGSDRGGHEPLTTGFSRRFLAVRLAHRCARPASAVRLQHARALEGVLVEREGAGAPPCRLAQASTAACGGLGGGGRQSSVPLGSAWQTPGNVLSPAAPCTHRRRPSVTGRDPRACGVTADAGTQASTWVASRSKAWQMTWPALVGDRHAQASLPGCYYRAARRRRHHCRHFRPGRPHPRDAALRKSPPTAGSKASTSSLPKARRWTR